jgi:hypothetical protein
VRTDDDLRPNRIKIGKSRRITDEQLAELIASLEDGNAA